MCTSDPLITYITVVKNGESSILRCMESIWNQSYKQIEYIVIDGNSSDGTMQVLNEHKAKIKKIVSEEDLGVYDAMNKGISLASGDLICFINADDLLLPGAADAIAKEFKRSGADVIAGRRNLVRDDGTVFQEENYPIRLIRNGVLKHNRLWHQAVYATKNAFNRIGLYDLEYPIIADYVWTMACINNGLHIELIEDVLCNYSLCGISSRNSLALEREFVRYACSQFSELSEHEANYIYKAFEPQTFYKVHGKALNDILCDTCSKELLNVKIETFLWACEDELFLASNKICLPGQRILKKKIEQQYYRIRQGNNIKKHTLVRLKKYIDVNLLLSRVISKLCRRSS